MVAASREASGGGFEVSDCLSVRAVRGRSVHELGFLGSLDGLPIPA